MKQLQLLFAILSSLFLTIKIISATKCDPSAFQMQFYKDGNCTELDSELTQIASTSPAKI